MNEGDRLLVDFQDGMVESGSAAYGVSGSSRCGISEQESGRIVPGSLLLFLFQLFTS